jgi:hypothetical protein
VKTRLEPTDCTQVQGKKIEEQCAVGLGGQGYHFPLLVGPGVVVNPLQIGGLATKTWTVVDQFAVDFSGGKIYERHRFLGTYSISVIAYGCTAGQRTGQKVVQS